jgi:hypothetical protein
MVRTVTILILEAEDALARFVTTSLIDRFVPELARTVWLRELWLNNLSSARTYQTISGPHVRVPSGLSGRAKDLFRAFHLSLAEQERRGEDLALVFAFDTDRSEAARSSLRQVRALHPEGSLVTVLAEATPEFDGWLLLGHEPANDRERQALDQIVKKLGFDPRRRVVGLNSTTGNERDAKRVCQDLLLIEHQAGPGDDGVERALRAEHDRLVAHADGTGFLEFVGDIRAELLPLLEGPFSAGDSDT